MDHSYNPPPPPTTTTREYEYVETIATLRQELQELRETTDEEYAIAIKMAATEREQLQSHIDLLMTQRDDAVMIQHIQQQHIDVLTTKVLHLEKQLLIAIQNQTDDDVVDSSSSSSATPILLDEERQEHADEVQEEVGDDHDCNSDVKACDEEDEEASSSSFDIDIIIADDDDVINTLEPSNVDDKEEEEEMEQEDNPVEDDDDDEEGESTEPTNTIKLPFLSTWPDASERTVDSSYHSSYAPPPPNSSTLQQHQVEYIYEAVQKKQHSKRENVFKSILNVLAPPQQPKEEHDSIISYFSKEKHGMMEGSLCKADVNLMGRCSFREEEEEAPAAAVVYNNYVKSQ